MWSSFVICDEQKTLISFVHFYINEYSAGHDTMYRYRHIDSLNEMTPPHLCSNLVVHVESKHNWRCSEKKIMSHLQTLACKKFFSHRLINWLWILKDKIYTDLTRIKASTWFVSPHLPQWGQNSKPILPSEIIHLLSAVCNNKSYQ